MIRVMIVAEHAEVRDGLSTILELSECIQVVEVVRGLHDVFRHSSLQSLDVALVDLEMPEDEGFWTIHQIRRQCPPVKVIALTSHDYPAARERAITAGASLVMVKGLGFSEMVAAIQAVVDRPER